MVCVRTVRIGLTLCFEGVGAEFWESFEQHKLDNREWKADTASNAEGTKNIFDKLFPAVTSAQLVSTPIASDFKSKLLLLPRLYARGDRKKMSAEKLIALGRTLPRPDQMQDATANKHFTNFSEYWSSLVIQKKLAADIQNPFLGLHIPLKRGRKARNERNNWTPTLEKALFQSPLYVGCASIHRRAVPGNEIHRDGLFWMPLLARTMGVRENEVCDALVGGIKLEETNGGPVWYLEIIDGKDSGSERNVPFAELVLGMGFLEQRVIGRNPSEPLFPELIPQGPGKRRSAAFTDRSTTGRQRTFINPGWIFIRFAAMSKLISKISPPPIRHGSMSLSAMNRPSGAPRANVTPSRSTFRYSRIW